MEDQKLLVYGFEAFDRFLRELPRAPARRVVMAGLRAGAQVVKAEARRAAPRREAGDNRAIRIASTSARVRGPGFLRRALVYRAVRGELRVLVGPRRAAFYGEFLETGRRAGQPWKLAPWFLRSFAASRAAALDRITLAADVQLIRETVKLRAGGGARG